MTFTALTGAVSNFTIGGGITDYSILILCIIFTLIGAMLTAKNCKQNVTKGDEPHAGFGARCYEHYNTCCS